MYQPITNNIIINCSYKNFTCLSTSALSALLCYSIFIIH